MMADWKIVSLDEVCYIVGGGTPSKGRADYYNGSIAWATVRDMSCEIISSTEHKITNAAVKDSATNIIPAGNVIIATRVGLGKVCFVSQDTAINQDLKGVIPKKPKELDVRFLFWWLRSVSYKIIQAGTGATVQGVKLPFIRSLQIPIPPISEQKRIVEILDEAFEGIDAAISNTEKNLANTCELFESALNILFTRRGDGWENKSLENICAVIGGGTPSKDNPTFYGGDIPWATIRDMKKEIISSTELKITKEAVRASSTNVIPKGNVVIATRVGLGKVCFLAQDTAINQDLRGIVPYDSQKIYVRFLFWWFKNISHLIIKEGTGATVQGVKLPFVKSLSVPVPPIIEQEFIVKKLDKLQEKTQQAKAIYEQKISSLNKLKQSLIQKAFRGELASSTDTVEEIAA